MRSFACAVVVMTVIGASDVASAQAVETTPPAPAAASIPSAPVPPAVVAAGTVVDIEIVDVVSTKTIKRGDTFPIRLHSPILLGDQVIVPAGTPGVGQVVDAAPSGALGKPAKLLLAARYLDFQGAHLPLHAMRLMVEGQDNSSAIFAASFVPYVGILAGFAHGGEIEIPAGTRALAKLAVDVPANPAPAASQPSASVPGAAGEKGKTQ